jgi:hypothetical protein
VSQDKAYMNLKMRWCRLENFNIEILFDFRDIVQKDMKRFYSPLSFSFGPAYPSGGTCRRIPLGVHSLLSLGGSQLVDFF